MIDIDKLLEDCANEKIHLIGEIQEFACLLAIDENFDIKIVSENFVDLGLSVGIGDSFKEVLSKNDIQEIEHLLEQEEIQSGYSLYLTKKKLRFYCYKTDQLLVLEHELYDDDLKDIKKENLIDSLLGFNIRGRQESGIKELASNLAVNIKSLVGYDRVMVYRFHPDDHGEVIAEEKEDHLEPFLNLHYPESDIPRQARELFIRNQIRIINHIDGKRFKLLSSHDTQLDLSDSISRAASHVHLEYLRNMHVGATLTISIVVDGRLWGLIACHHYSLKFISYSTRSLLKIVGFSFATEVSKYLAHQYNARLKDVNHLTVSLLNELENIGSVFETNYLDHIVTARSSQILKLMEANGVYVEVGNHSTTVGVTPSKSVIQFIKKQISKSSESIFYTNSLSEYDESFQSFAAETSGVLGVGITSTGLRNCFVMWFRPETITEISWAGKNDKNIVYDGKHARLSPRGSFEEIIKLQKQSSFDFTKQDLDIAFEFIWFLSKVLLKQLDFAEKNLISLEQEAREKDRFISALSHELRTPLNNILGWLQLYHPQLHKTEELAELYKVINNNSKQQLRLINDLLDISKVASGKIKLDLKALEINESIMNIYNYFKPSFKSKGIDCFVSLNESLTCAIDETRFEQILRNILQNSLKFTPRHGQIFISAKKEKSEATIEIRDTGVGIDKEELALVSNEFYQATNNKTAVSNKGMGLGLALVKNIVELHGGDMSIESDGKNIGTSVKIHIPLINMTIKKNLEEEDELAHSSEFHIGSSLKGKKIMLVEDTIESARCMKIFLENEGAEVSWFGEAYEALKALKNHNYDLILSDIGLPVMDGLEFVGLAREIGDYKKIPFIALSAYGTDSEINNSIAAGYNLHLVKPVELNQLLVTIAEYI